MGCGSSSPEDSAARERNKQIEREMKTEARKQEQVIKLLLLGAGESGKSTIFKQMKIIHRNGYNRDECARYRDVIYANTLQSMKALVVAAMRMRIPLQSEENKGAAERILSIPEQQIIASPWRLFDAHLGAQISALWKDSGIQTSYLRRSEFQLNDSAAYFFTQIDRLCQQNYVPSQQDVLRSRVKTVGIVEEEFLIEGYKFKMVDVGGQRNERRKWIHCFDDVTAIIFVTSLSEYDQRLAEDDTTNRMRESLALFEEICNTKYFKDTSIIIFFNKRDLFEEKIRAVDLNVCFPEYKGGKDYDAAAAFIEDRFVELNKSKTRQLYVHFTCATDTENIRVVFNAVKNIILHNNLRDANLL